jgi:hypothetical protein
MPNCKTWGVAAAPLNPPRLPRRFIGTVPLRRITMSLAGPGRVHSRRFVAADPDRVNADHAAASCRPRRQPCSRHTVLDRKSR